jgi:predicted nucleic acid-binding protein
LILIDSSVWIEYLRGTGSSAHLRLREMIETDVEMALTDAVAMEVLAGARDDGHRDRLRALLHSRCRYVPSRAPDDYERAADLFRACRRNGETIGKLTDCLIAAAAIRTGARVLHRDGDFSVLARHSALEADAA